MTKIELLVFIAVCLGMGVVLALLIGGIVFGLAKVENHTGPDTHSFVLYAVGRVALIVIVATLLAGIIIQVTVARYRSRSPYQIYKEVVADEFSADTQLNILLGSSYFHIPQGFTNQRSYENNEVRIKYYDPESYQELPMLDFGYERDPAVEPPVSTPQDYFMLWIEPGDPRKELIENRIPADLSGLLDVQEQKVSYGTAYYWEAGRNGCGSTLFALPFKSGNSSLMLEFQTCEGNKYHRAFDEREATAASFIHRQEGSIP